MSKVVKINSKKSIVSLDKEDLSSYDLIKWVRTSSLGVGHRCFIDEQPFEKVAAQIHKEKYPSDQVKVAEAVVKNHDGTIDVFLKVTATYTEGMYKKDSTKLVFAGPEDAEIVKEINSDVSKTAFSVVSDDDYIRLDKEAGNYQNPPEGGGYIDSSGRFIPVKEIPQHQTNDDNSGQKPADELAAAPVPADPNATVPPQVTASVKKAFNFDKKEEDASDEDDDKEIKDDVDEHESEEELEEDIKEDKEEGDDEADLEADEKALEEIEEDEGSEEENEDESDFKAELQKFIDEKGVESLIDDIPEEELDEMKAILGMGDSCEMGGEIGGEMETEIPHLPPLKTMDMVDKKPMIIEFGEGKDPFAELFGKHLKPEIEEHGLDMVAAVVSVMLKK